MKFYWLTASIIIHSISTCQCFYTTMFCYRTSKCHKVFTAACTWMCTVCPSLPWLSQKRNVDFASREKSICPRIHMELLVYTNLVDCRWQCWKAGQVIYTNCFLSFLFCLLHSHLKEQINTVGNWCFNSLWATYGLFCFLLKFNT